MTDLKILNGGATTATVASGDPDLHKFYTREQACQLIHEKRGLSISPKTLANKSWSGAGPRWTRFGKRAVLQGKTILDWIDAELTKPAA
jgi:hypothetical protein